MSTKVVKERGRTERGMDERCDLSGQTRRK